MRKEFIVERQGRAFCLYAGLLDLAHQQGLKSIQTQLVQVPAEANNRVAICTATVVLEKEGQEHVFTGIGDAALNNVAPAMQTCLIRMAETRAKARALRDAVNIGVAAFEELGEEDAHDGAPERGYAVGSYRGSRNDRPTAPLRNGNGVGMANRTAAPPRAAETANAPIDTKADMKNTAADPATEAQLEAIRSLCRRQSLDPDEAAREKYSVEALAKLTQGQASEMIRQFNGRANGRTPAAAA